MERFAKDKLCPQCEGVASFAYHENRAQYAPVCTEFESPHMHRTCNQCDYDWAEAPLA